MKCLFEIWIYQRLGADEMYNELDMNLTQMLLLNINNRVRSMNDLNYNTVAGRKSGDYTTTTGNTLIEQVTIIYSFCQSRNITAEEWYASTVDPLHRQVAVNVAATPEAYAKMFGVGDDNFSVLGPYAQGQQPERIKFDDDDPNLASLPVHPDSAESAHLPILLRYVNRLWNAKGADQLSRGNAILRLMNTLVLSPAAIPNVLVLPVREAVHRPGDEYSMIAKSIGFIFKHKFGLPNARPTHEYCNHLFMPVDAPVRTVLLPQIGRQLYKHGWMMHRPEEHGPQWMRATALGLVRTWSCVPVLRVFLEHYLRRLPQEPREFKFTNAELRDMKYTIRAADHHTCEPATLAFFFLRYGLDALLVEREVGLLLRLAPFGQLLSHPYLDTICKIDNA